MALNEEGLMDVPGMCSRWVRLASGCKAHYMTSGESGPAVLLLHGGMWGSSGTAAWPFLAPFLAANGFRVYCPDFPGFGLTEQYEEVYAPDLSGHLDFLHEFVTALCIDRFHISGNSMGCQNTVNYVTAHPKKILSFALIAGGVEDVVRMEDVFGGPIDRGIIFDFDGTRESMVKIIQSLVTDMSKVPDDLIDMRLHAARKHHEYYLKMNEHIIFFSPDPDTRLQMSSKGRFDRLSIPGIYLHGMEDRSMKMAYAQEDALPKVQFFYAENTGHQAQTDSPELVNQLFLEFFRDGKVSWDTAQAAGISQRRAPLPNLVAVPDPATR